MRYVALMPHTMDAYFTQEAADSTVGQTVPFRVEGSEIGTTATVLAARVDERGLHLEFDVPSDAKGVEALMNVVIYGHPHGPDAVLPVAPEFSIGHSVGRAEVDPLVHVGCVQSPGVLDTHESRDALREVVKAASSRFFSEAARTPVDPAAHD